MLRGNGRFVNPATVTHTTTLVAAATSVAGGVTDVHLQRERRLPHPRHIRDERQFVVEAGRCEVVDFEAAARHPKARIVEQLGIGQARRPQELLLRDLDEARESAKAHDRHEIHIRPADALMRNKGTRCRHEIRSKTVTTGGEIPYSRKALGRTSSCNVQDHARTV